MKISRTLAITANESIAQNVCMNQGGTTDLSVLERMDDRWFFYAEPLMSKRKARKRRFYEFESLYKTKNSI